MSHITTINTFTFCILFLISVCTTDPIVTTRFGQIQGFTGNYDDAKYEAFIGIPFAEPPLGDLRFQLPKPFNSTWSTPYQALNYGNGCYQKPASYFNFNISEDCLYLNIWRPEMTDQNDDSELFPVLYFLHGSGYTSSSSSMPQVQGNVLAATQKIIVVSSNYRLGAFGFAYGSHTLMPGNLGLYDALTVLRWIRDNIKSFGGDPNEVTLSGQSAGSKMVSFLASLPDKFESQTLFSRLIMMSGVATNQIHADSESIALAKTRLLASKVNCLSQIDKLNSSNELSDETIDCLKKTDANDILKAQNSKDITTIGCSEITVFLPVHGTDLIPNRPMINHGLKLESLTDKPMLFGAEQDEASMFTPSQVSGIFTLKDAYEYTKQRISFAIKDIKTDKIDSIYKYYFKDVDPSNVYDIRSRCVKLASDMNYHCPSLILSEFFSQKNSDIHFYLNSYAGENLAQNSGRLYGTKHGDDVVFGFGDPIRQPNLYTPNDKKFSQLALDLFGSFVKGSHLTDWPSIVINPNDYEPLQIIKRLNLLPTNIVDHDQKICIKWTELFSV